MKIAIVNFINDKKITNNLYIYTKREYIINF